MRIAKTQYDKGRDCMETGSRIRERRRELGLSQDELAQKVGYKNRSTIARIESDENDVTQSKLKEIAQALKTQVPWLMYGDERFKDSRYVEVSVGFDTSRKTKQPYYIDPEVAAIANELKNNPDMRVLFDASRHLSKQDIQTVAALVKSLSQKGGD